MTNSTQILGLRTFINAEGANTTYDAFYERNWRAESLPALFANIDSIINKIPSDEQWNLFYTLATCSDKRKFVEQSVLAWDIDGLDGLTTDEKKAYIPIVCQALGLPDDKVFVVNSGNGLHFIINLKDKITDDKYFAAHREGYKKTCVAIDQALADKKLVGSADPAIFEPRRILRLPNTLNKKPNKPISQCELLQTPTPDNWFSQVDFTLEKIRKNAKDWGAVEREKELQKQKREENKNKKLSEKEQEKLDKQQEKERAKEEKNAEKRAAVLKTVRPDNAAILQGCKFLQWAKVHQSKVTEPEWYAALSIVGRMEDGKRLAHEFSSQHATYTPSGTDAKLEQALTASGPRTCENINDIWKGDDGRGCETCPYYKSDVVTSPISIQGPDFVATEHNGFHRTILSGNGVKNIPDYEGLRRYFSNETSYKVLDPSRIIYKWAGTHYTEASRVWVEAYAQAKFVPHADTKMVMEFRQLAERHNLHSIDWFTTGNQGKMNFLNGVLDIPTGGFSPSDKELGFRYVLPYEYDSGAVCPTFDHMLDKITCGDAQLATILLEFIGYALSGDSYWCHKALVLVGDGSNGKSTLLNVIKMLAGGANYSAMQMGAFTSEYNRQVLDGKLFNLSEETNHKAFSDSSLFKGLVGGVGMQVRAPYGLPYTIANSAKLILTCNELPRNWDASGGMERRLLIVPFNHTFSENDADYDPFVDEKLRDELPGILLRCVSAYKKLMLRKKFSEATASKTVQKEYMLENNTVKLWAAEELYTTGVNPSEFTKLSDLYSAYNLFCDKFNHYPVGYAMFFKQLSKFIPDYGNKVKCIKREAKVFKALLGYKCEQERGEHIN